MKKTVINQMQKQYIHISLRETITLKRVTKRQLTCKWDNAYKKE